MGALKKKLTYELKVKKCDEVTVIAVWLGLLVLPTTPPSPLPGKGFEFFGHHAKPIFFYFIEKNLGRKVMGEREREKRERRERGERGERERRERERGVIKMEMNDSSWAIHR